jgi:hypothetical protein
MPTTTNMNATAHLFRIPRLTNESLAEVFPQLPRVNLLGWRIVAIPDISTRNFRDAGLLQFTATTEADFIGDTWLQNSAKWRQSLSLYPQS